MISSSITADLGKCDQLRGNAEALSTVTGIIDGTGSIGAAIGQWFIPSVQHWFGWDAVFYGFIVMVRFFFFLIEKKDLIKQFNKNQEKM